MGCCIFAPSPAFRASERTSRVAWHAMCTRIVMALDVYRKKRNFSTTPEPKGRVGRSTASGLAFVIQKHRASHLHYDFRLELDGVLLSWAVPKGPSLDPADKCLAIHVEDHPLEYGEFEGVIPSGQYGSGTVLLWDRGRWIPEGDGKEAYRKGKLKFSLEGEKLHGKWTLVRAWGSKSGEEKSWFLIKGDDAYARRNSEVRVVDMLPRSVASGRDLDEIAADPDRVWHSNKSVAENMRTGALERKKPALRLAGLPGARKASLPKTLSPQLATLAKAPPVGDAWVHEIKYDGYRMVCRIAKGEAHMHSRTGKEWTAQFAPIARALARLPVREAWLDGEVVVTGADGRTSFQALQNALSAGDTGGMTFWLFDLMYLDGYDLRAVPLLERKRVLKAVLEGQPALLHYSEHFAQTGETVYAQACKLKLEGIVSKRQNSTYRTRRGTDWLKVKCALRQEMVIGGFTDPGGSRTGFGALLLGVHDATGSLKYCGKVGTGFNQNLLETLSAKLAQIEQSKPAFANPPRGYEARGAHWVKPELVAEIAFTEWTRDGTARHPSFQGLRADKRARDVVLELPLNPAAVEATSESAGARARTVSTSAGREKANAHAAPAARVGRPRTGAADKAAKIPARRANLAAAGTVRAGSKRKTPENAVAGIAISNPDKILYPESGITKLELARYYEAVGDWMLPHLRNRPLTLVRCPSGWEKSCFYQKHVNNRVADVIDTVEVEEKSGPALYMMANSVSAIIALLQMGVLEFHPWGSTSGHLDRPDRLVFDFDPDADLGWDRIVEAVRVLRKLLDNIGLQGYLRTTGGKGLHVVVPVRPTLGWGPIKSFTKAIADLLVSAFPDRFTAKLAKAQRGGKIFVDYLRNAEGSTAIASYSVRAKAGAPVATPIAWEEIADDVRFDHFNVRNLPARLGRMKGNPWETMITNPQEIGPSVLQRMGLGGR